MVSLNLYTPRFNPSKLSLLVVRPGALAQPATARVSNRGAARSNVDMRRESFKQTRSGGRREPAQSIARGLRSASGYTRTHPVGAGIVSICASTAVAVAGFDGPAGGPLGQCLL